MKGKLPEIVLVRASCAAYGYCWHASTPYYTGHYRTKTAAAVAAAKTKRALKARAANAEKENDNG